jgi:hypothetical protein
MAKYITLKAVEELEFGNVLMHTYLQSSSPPAER